MACIASILEAHIFNYCTVNVLPVSDSPTSTVSTPGWRLSAAGGIGGFTSVRRRAVRAVSEPGGSPSELSHIDAHDWLLHAVACTDSHPSWSNSGSDFSML
jgi:hypothetical protein